MPEDDILDLNRTKGMERDYILDVLKVETTGYLDGLEVALEIKTERGKDYLRFLTSATEKRSCHQPK